MKSLDTYIQEKKAELEICLSKAVSESRDYDSEGTYDGKFVLEAIKDFLESLIRQIARETVEAVIQRKETEEYTVELWRGFKKGWNNCLDRILASAKERGILSVRQDRGEG